MDVYLKGCIDTQVTCPFSTDKAVQKSDRQWKDGSFEIPAGKHTVLLTDFLDGCQLYR